MPARGQHARRLSASAEFARLCEGFHQDCMIDAPSLDSLTEHVLRHISTKDSRPLKAFLDRILDGTYTAHELRGFMNRSTPNFAWRNARGVVEMLRNIRARLDTHAK